MDEPKCDVLIIGGGLAGLTSALALATRGLAVTVLEADERLGGRASSWIDKTTGDPIHIGPHIFLNCYPNMMKLLDVLGTRDKVVWQRQKGFITMADGEEKTVITSSWLPAPYTMAPSLLMDRRVSVRDLWSNWPIVQLALAADEALVSRLDDYTARELLTSFGVTPRFIDRFWSFTSFAIMNIPLELCSAGALIRFYRHLIGHSDLMVGFSDGGLGDVYAPEAERRIKAAGSQVLTRTRVAELVVDAGQVKGVRLADGRVLRARHVIAALPPAQLAAIVPAELRTSGVLAELDRFESVPYVSQYLWFDRKLTDLQFWARSFSTDDLNCDFYDLSNINRGWEERPSLITSNIIFSHRIAALSDAEIIAETRREIAEFLPGAREATLRHHVVHRIPMAIHAPRPGTERLRPSSAGAAPGLLLASDWVQTGFPSSMESAVAAGWMAAEEILRDHDRPEVLRQALPPIERTPRLVRAVGKLLPNGRLERRLERLARAAAPSASHP
ncbi:MAG: amine oxidase [Deltaproteobacteria bacterium]|nr:amine oxidase [Deltaproteobacteria bacterium]